MKTNNQRTFAFTLFFAFALAGCGGGGGGSSGGGGGGSNNPAPLSDLQIELNQELALVQPAPGETTQQAEMRMANNDVNPSPMSPIKVYVPATQTLSVGSLTDSEMQTAFASEVEGVIIRFSVYDSDGNEIFDPRPTGLACDSRTGPCPVGIDDHDEIFDLIENDLADEGLYDRDLGAFSASRARYERAFADAVAQTRFSTATFTHSVIGFEHFRRSDSNFIHTDALKRVSEVLARGGTSTNALDVFDVALFGQRHSTSANRLDYMDFGVWAVNAQGEAYLTEDFLDNNGNSLRLVGGLAFGVRTPAALIPTAETATYDGLVAGLVGPRSGTDTSGLRGVSGDARIVANFATDEVTATFSNMMSSAATTAVDASTPYHNFMFTGTLDADSRNQYTAADVAISNPATTIADNIDLLDNLEAGQTVPTGNLEGRFYGPVADGETGGRWTLGDTDTIAVGAFGAKRQ